VCLIQAWPRRSGGPLPGLWGPLQRSQVLQPGAGLLHKPETRRQHVPQRHQGTFHTLVNTIKISLTLKLSCETILNTNEI